MRQTLLLCTGAAALFACGGSDSPSDAAVVFEPDPATCQSAADCQGGQCVSVPKDKPTTSGCSFTHAQAKTPSNNPALDQCVGENDCADAAAGCFLTNNCIGTSSALFNQCLVNECDTAADCDLDLGPDQQAVCLPAGFLNYPTSRCVPANCTADADCTDDAGGTCLLLIDSCDLSANAFFCGYASDECHSIADCDIGAGETCNPDPQTNRLHCETDEVDE